MSNNDATAAPPRYAALALQLATHCVNDCRDGPSARERIAENLRRVRRAVGGSRAFIRQFNGVDIRLVVVPEYFLTGFPMQETVPEWQAKAALALDGPEYQSLGTIARDFDLYLAGNAYEIDPAFPELYFQCCFIVAPSGEVVLRYRRLVSLSARRLQGVHNRKRSRRERRSHRKNLRRSVRHDRLEHGASGVRERPFSRRRLCERNEREGGIAL